MCILLVMLRAPDFLFQNFFTVLNLFLYGWFFWNIWVILNKNRFKYLANRLKILLNYYQVTFLALQAQIIHIYLFGLIFLYLQLLYLHIEMGKSSSDLEKIKYVKTKTLFLIYLEYGWKKACCCFVVVMRLFNMDIITINCHSLRRNDN